MSVNNDKKIRVELLTKLIMKIIETNTWQGEFDKEGCRKELAETLVEVV